MARHALNPARCPWWQDVALWPNDGRHYSDRDVVCTTCDACALWWRVHRDLAGFRLRCRCGEWVLVPTVAAARAAIGG